MIQRKREWWRQMETALVTVVYASYSLSYSTVCLTQVDPIINHTLFTLSHHLLVYYIQGLERELFSNQYFFSFRSNVPP